MLTPIAIGLLMTVFCFLLQAIAAAVIVRLLLKGRRAASPGTRGRFIRLLIALGILSLGIIAHMAAWALLCWQAGLSADAEEALYFSGITFTSLGYGDLVFKGEARFLAPLQATTGLTMFAIATALLVNLIETERRRQDG
jgi:hypothetical protein